MTARRLALASVACCLLAGCWSPSLGTTLQPADVHETTGAAPGYVADRMCAECHRELYDAFQHTGKVDSFFRPAADKVIEDFANATFFHEPSQAYFQMTEHDGSYLFTRYQQEASGERINVFRRRVDWVVGSGRSRRSYLYQTEAGELFQLPVAWYSQERQWGMAPGFDRPDNAGVLQPVQRQCVFCHNGYPEMAAGSDACDAPQSFPTDMPQGLGCQRCHGPGGEHIRLALAGDPLAAVAAIVNPAQLEPAVREDVCHSCHLQVSSAVLPARRMGRGDFSFRPGEPLEEFLLPLDFVDGRLPAAERFESNHHAYRLQQSECFQESGGGVSCLDCHDPHRRLPADERAARFRDACLKCHTTDRCTVDATSGAPFRFEGVARDNCAVCHMPKRRTQDVVHVVATDHRIQREMDGPERLAPRVEQPPQLTDVVLTVARGAVEDASQDVALQIETAAAVLQISRYDDVATLDKLQTLLDQHSVDAIEPYLHLAQGQLKHHRFEAAEQTLRALVARIGPRPLIGHLLGTSLLGQGKNDLAIAQ